MILLTIFILSASITAGTLVYRATGSGYYKREYGDWFWVVFLGAVSGGAALLVAAIIDSCANTRTLVGDGTVVSSSYTPESNSSGSGVAVTPKGPVPVFTNSHTPEKRQLFVRINGEIVECDVDLTTLFDARPGCTASVYRVRGSVFGFNLGYEAKIR